MLKRAGQRHSALNDTHAISIERQRVFFFFFSLSPFPVSSLLFLAFVHVGTGGVSQRERCLGFEAHVASMLLTKLICVHAMPSLQGKLGEIKHIYVLCIIKYCCSKD